MTWKNGVLPVEMASNKLVDLLFVNSMKILEFVQGRELFDVESIGCDNVGLPL